MPENTPRVDVRSIAVRMTLQAVLEAQGLVTDVIEDDDRTPITDDGVDEG